MRSARNGIRAAIRVRNPNGRFSPFDSDYGKLKATADLSGLMIKGSKQYLDAIKSDPSGVIVKINTDKAVAPIKAGDVVGAVEYLFTHRIQ